jgi:hypothetical protein
LELDATMMRNSRCFESNGEVVNDKDDGDASQRSRHRVIERMPERVARIERSE